MEIKTNNIKFLRDHNEFGLMFEVTCPVCSQIIIVADLDFRQPKCKCGYVWSFDIVATGMKDDDQSE